MCTEVLIWFLFKYCDLLILYRAEGNLSPWEIIFLKEQKKKSINKMKLIMWPHGWAHLEFSGGPQTITLSSKVGHCEAVTGCTIFLSPGHQIWEVVISDTLKYYRHTCAHRGLLITNNIISLFSYFSWDLMFLTLVFLWYTFLYSSIHLKDKEKEKYHVGLTLLFLANLLH